MAPDDSAASDGVGVGESTAPGHDDTDLDDLDDDDRDPARVRRRRLIIGAVVLVLALAGATGWLGYRAYEAQQAEQERQLYLDVGKQAAQNLTTIDWQQAEADVQRVLDVATGTFYDDFERRAKPFIEVVKEAQSKSVGTLRESGVESVSDNGARVLVAITVQSSNAGAPDQAPKAWRMRLTLQRVDDTAKVSNVEFVQ
jgi:Mce-associated membrane protein